MGMSVDMHTPNLFHFPRPISRNAVVPCHAMSSQTSFPTVNTVSISFSQLKLKDKNSDLLLKIEEGFGPNGLGILSVTDVPGYSSLRRNLLHLAPRLANLPKEVKEDLEDPHSRYNFGWSHGKEKLESGKPDILKGSFYANPILDTPTTEASLLERYPSYCGSNIWPKSALPELEVAFKALGKLIFDVGLMLAYHCDQYGVSKGMKMRKDEGLESILCHSRCHKGRLLYYFPAQQGIPDGNPLSSWCGWHTDHGSLTGLTCAMFMKDGVEITCPDSAAGLYICSRNDQIVKVVYGKDDIAYQIGETTEILSGGYLCATPHCVQL
ncbi:uncharacterized protein LOC113864986 isoform X2 [Abrus precatorius]|uniref:Uncharacterized protein LOC113864986 isoform X2 n=1 Tax=Abrus precatorius TaxID=3816 RepID=A0A8B8LG32_ABRPR|nr:uncharacterized protein LOC113864986 isoform X2 [Abrus precatorius]